MLLAFSLVYLKKIANLKAIRIQTILSVDQRVSLRLEYQKTAKYVIQFGTQVNFRWSRDHNNRTAENAFSAPWYFSEMELEPVAG